MNIPSEVLEAAEEAYYATVTHSEYDSYLVIAEWARKEALAEVLSACEENRVFLRTVRRGYVEEDYSNPLVRLAVIRALAEGEGQ